MATSYPTYTPNQVSYLGNLLSRLVPGLDPTVAQAWISAEKGANGNVLGLTVANGQATNVYPGQTGVFQASNGQWLATFGSQDQGIYAAAQHLLTSPSYQGVRSSLGTGSQAKEAQALIASPWNKPGSPWYTQVFTDWGLLGTGMSSSPIADPSTPSSVPSGPTESLASFLGISPNLRGDSLWNAVKNAIIGSGTKYVSTGTPSDATALLGFIEQQGGLQSAVLGIPNPFWDLQAPTAGSIQVPVTSKGQADIAAITKSNAATNAMTGGLPTAQDVTNAAGNVVNQAAQAAAGAVVGSMAPLIVGAIVLLVVAVLAFRGVSSILGPAEPIPA